MNLEESFILDKIYEDKENVISSDNLKDKTDRTLLYGYTCDRNTWHVYIKDEVIHTIWYNARDEDIAICELPSQGYISNEIYIPNKRLYLECCDLEFCILLKKKGVRLPFTNYDNKIEKKQFYGLIK